jgi:acetyl-CoA acetyltransferase
MTQEAFICEAGRTPIGRCASALTTVRVDDLAAVSIKGGCLRVRASAGFARRTVGADGDAGARAAQIKAGALHHLRRCWPGHFRDR